MSSPQSPALPMSLSMRRPSGFRCGLTEHRANPLQIAQQEPPSLPDQRPCFAVERCSSIQMPSTCPHILHDEVYQALHLESELAFLVLGEERNLFLELFNRVRHHSLADYHQFPSDYAPREAKSEIAQLQVRVILFSRCAAI